MTQLLNPKPPSPVFTDDEPKAATGMRKERRRRHDATAAQCGSGPEKMAVTAEVVLGLFWSGFGCNFFWANMIEFWWILEVAFSCFG